MGYKFWNWKFQNWNLSEIEMNSDNLHIYRIRYIFHKNFRNHKCFHFFIMNAMLGLIHSVETIRYNCYTWVCGMKWLVWVSGMKPLGMCNRYESDSTLHSVRPSGTIHSVRGVRYVAFGTTIRYDPFGTRYPVQPSGIRYPKIPIRYKGDSIKYVQREIR